MKVTRAFYFYVYSIILLIGGLATNGWKHCGSLFSSGCNFVVVEELLISREAAKWLFVATLIDLLIASLLEILCASQKNSQGETSVVMVARAIVSCLALVLLLSGIMVITHFMGNLFSYAATVFALGFVLHVHAILFYCLFAKGWLTSNFICSFFWQWIYWWNWFFVVHNTKIFITFGLRFSGFLFRKQEA